MRKEGYRESTCRYAVQVLNGVARRAQLLNPDEVKGFLAKATCSESRKQRISWDLARFYKWKGVPFEMPRYRQVEKLPFIPLETEIDQLISGCGHKTATLLQLLKESGMRCGEAWNSKWTDIDYERNTIVVQPEKNSRSRILKISNRLISMLNQLPKDSQYVFRKPTQDPIASLLYARRNFEKQRNTLAKKLQNPRLVQIHFHTFRHFFATKLYHQTKDILHVMRMLGHHNIMMSTGVDFGVSERGLTS
jgi:integrase/recombinase XerD